MQEISYDKLIEISSGLEPPPRQLFKLCEIEPAATAAGAELDKLLGSVPAIYYHVLDAANATHFSSDQRIENLQEAVLVHGFESVLQMILGSGCITPFQQKSRVKFDRKKLWFHEIIVSRAAKLTAEQLGTVSYQDRINLQITALLHDIGIFIMELYFPERFVAAVNLCRKEKKPYIEAEWDINGPMTHEEIGKTLAEIWGLPPFIVEAVKFHHDPTAYDGSTFNEFINMFYLAHYCADLTGLGNFSGGKVAPLDEMSLSYVNLTKDHLKALTITTLDQQRHAEDLLSYLVPDPPEQKPAPRKPRPVKK